MASGAAHAQWLFDFQDLGTLGGQNSAALGMNSAGHVVGSADDAKGKSTAFVWRGAGMQAVPTPLTGTASSATDISDNGDIVGLVQDAVVGGCSLRNNAGFRLSNGTASVLLPGRGTNAPSLSDNATAAASISEFGFNCLPSAGPAFRFVANTTTTLFALQDGFDVNNAGVVAGTGVRPTTALVEANTFDGVTRQQLGSLCSVPQNCASSALAINNQGLVVGESSIDTVSFGTRNVRAFAFRNQRMSDLGGLSGFEESRALGVDDAENVVGSAKRRSDNAQRALLFGNAGLAIDLNNVTSNLNGFTLESAQDVRPIYTKLGTFPYPVLDGLYVVGVANKPGVGRHAFRLVGRAAPVKPIAIRIDPPIYRDGPPIPHWWYLVDIKLPEQLACPGGLNAVFFDEKAREQVIEPAGLIGERYPYLQIPAEVVIKSTQVQLELRASTKLSKSALSSIQLFCTPRLTK